MCTRDARATTRGLQSKPRAKERRGRVALYGVGRSQVLVSTEREGESGYRLVGMRTKFVKQHRKLVLHSCRVKVVTAQRGESYLESVLE